MNQSKICKRFERAHNCSFVGNIFNLDEDLDYKGSALKRTSNGEGIFYVPHYQLILGPPSETLDQIIAANRELGVSEKSIEDYFLNLTPTGVYRTDATISRSAFD